MQLFVCCHIRSLPEGSLSCRCRPTGTWLVFNLKWLLLFSHAGFCRKQLLTSPSPLFENGRRRRSLWLPRRHLPHSFKMADVGVLSGCCDVTARSVEGTSSAGFSLLPKHQLWRLFWRQIVPRLFWPTQVTFLTQLGQVLPGFG